VTAPWEDEELSEDASEIHDEGEYEEDKEDIVDDVPAGVEEYGYEEDELDDAGLDDTGLDDGEYEYEYEYEDDTEDEHEEENVMKAEDETWAAESA